MDLNELKSVQNILELGLEDVEVVQKVGGKFLKAFDLLMQDSESSQKIDKTIKEKSGFYVIVDILQALENRLTVIDNNINALGAMFAQFLNRNDPELARQIIDAVNAQTSVNQQIRQKV